MKNTIKRTVKYLLLFVAVIMMIFVTNTETLAAEEFTEGYYTYTVTDGEATIVDVDKGISGDIVIPETLGGYPITAIRFFSFEDCKEIVSVKIPDSVIEIYSNAFYNCERLTNIYLGKNVSLIGYGAFYGTAYYNDINNRDNGLLYLDNFLIDADTSTDNCYIREGTTHICDEAFTFSGFDTVYIPKTVSYISGNFTNSAFYHSWINNIIVDDENPYFMSEDGVVYNKDKTLLVAYPTGRDATDFVIPATVKNTYGCNAGGASIKKLSFENGCQFEGWYCGFFYFASIEEIVIPNSADLQKIHFGNMAHISKVTFESGELEKTLFSDTLFNISDCAMDVDLSSNFIEIENKAVNNGWDSIKTLTIRNPHCKIFDSADTIKAGITIYGYENSTAQKYAQKYNRTFVALECDHTLNYKYVEANGCNNAYEHYECNCGKIAYDEEFPNTAKHLYVYKYVSATCITNAYECYKCESCGTEKDKIEFADTALGHSYTESIISQPTCNTVGKKQFYCTTCNTYKYETIPTNDKHIDNDNNGYCDRCNVLFAYTEGDYHYTVKDEKATIIFVDKSISGDVVIPSTLGGYPVTAIGEEAFAECFNITRVVIPEGITYIDEDAFALCYRMESVTLPESLEVIDNWVFGACLSLKEIVLPESVVNINTSAFDSCLLLEKIVVKNTEASIGEYICHTTLLPKDISTSEWVERYITAYEAIMNGDENAETLMAELETHTTILENEVAVLPELTIYSHDPSTAKTYAEENGIPFKNISELEEPHTCSFDEWFTETEPTVFSEGVSKRVCECGEFETKPIAKLESAVTKDDTTKVEITYTEENFESEIDVIVSEEEINANFAFGDEFENYKAYDISLVADGEKVQPNGNVTVKLPIPEGFNADTTEVYYIAPDGTKTKLDSTVENGYVVFETNHFSEYVLVDESSKIEPPHVHSYTAVVTKTATCTEPGTTTYTCSCGDTYTEAIDPTGHDFDGSKCKNCGFDKASDCSCSCHKGGIMGFFWKIINFFNKLFRLKQTCACGAAHY